MAAVRPAFVRDGNVASRRARGVSSTPARVGCTAVSLASAVVGLFVANAYPIASPVALLVFVAWTALAFARISIALPALLALLPVTGFATFTGWLTFEELDLLILASAAGGYAAAAWRPRAETDPAMRRHRPKLSIFSLTLIALFVASLACALDRGLAASGGLRLGWFQGYIDPLNGLRIFKSFAWCVLMTPLLLAELRKPEGLDRIAIGMTAGLGLCGLAVLQERLAFTGLTDFNDDYRVTGPFWEMHVGGAALDGYLALALPFAVREAVANGSAATRVSQRLRFVAACLVLALAAYAALVTFSRGVYAALPVSLLLLVVLIARQHLRLARRDAWRSLAKAVVFAAVVAASCFVVFRAGGYRSVLAALCVLAIGVPIEAVVRRTAPAGWLAAAIAALVAGAAGQLVGGLLPKGPYVVFGLAAAAAAAAALQATRRPSRAMDLAAIAAWLWLAVDACLVALHWGGPAAGRDAGAIAGVLVLLPFALSRATRPLWPQKPHEQLAAVGIAALVMGSVAVFTAGAYMGGRFASTRDDLGLRTSHWTAGLGRIHGIDAWLFGMGLGRFPATSLFDSPDGEVPGSYRFETRDGETFVALSAPRIKYLGFGELFRFSQRVDVKPDTTYVVTILARSVAGGTLHVELCEKQLLYNAACIGTDATVPVATIGWKRVTVPLPTGSIGRSAWYAPRPVFFALAAGDPSSAIEVHGANLIGPDGRDSIANGDFANGTAHWFSSSDRYHLPWHIKNIALNVLFDQGVVGLGLFVLLVVGALLRVTVGRAFRHRDAPYVAAAIAGYLVVGAADSLLDVPRGAFAFYLVTMIGLMLRNPHARKPDEAVATPPAVTRDEAAERAARRQQAFGRRKPLSG